MKKSQGLLEYVLVFMFAAVVMYYFASQIDLKKLKTFAIYGTKSSENSQTLTIPPMTK